jgi:hypothetical protein
VSGFLVCYDGPVEDGERVLRPTSEVFDVAAEALDLGYDAPDRLAHDQLDLFIIQTLGELSGAGEIREQDSDDSVLLAHPPSFPHGRSATGRIVKLWRAANLNSRSSRHSRRRERHARFSQGHYGKIVVVGEVGGRPSGLMTAPQ